MKALVEKDISMKKQEKEMRKALHSFYVHLSRELEGTRGNSRELEGTRGNSKFFKGSARRSNRRKKLRKGGKEVKFHKSDKNKKKKKRENIEALYERLKIR